MVSRRRSWTEVAAYAVLTYIDSLLTKIAFRAGN
jgi:hypothetical protein